MTAELPAPVDAQAQREATPRRGDVFEQWLKAQRDAAADYPEARDTADGLLDLYRLHADTDTPLDEHVCEGQAVGNCECLEPHDYQAHAEETQQGIAMVCRDCLAPVMWVDGANGGWWNHTLPVEDGHSIVPKPLLRTPSRMAYETQRHGEERRG